MFCAFYVDEADGGQTRSRNPYAAGTAKNFCSFSRLPNRLGASALPTIRLFMIVFDWI
jgi:hypothetical protein